MPIPTPQKQAARESLGGFVGVNLRQDRLNLAQEAVAKAINLDFHRQPRSAILRLGRADQFSTSLGATIRRLAKHNGQRYQIAGTTVFRNQAAVLGGLSNNLFTTIQPFRPLGDPSEWVFIADDALMRKYDGANVRNWGIEAPANAPTLAAGAAAALVGDYMAAYTYARFANGNLVTESALSPSPTAQTLASEALSITYVASTDPQVTNIRIYRTLTGGTSFFFERTVPNAGATVESSGADSTLGAGAPTDVGVPNSMSWVTEFQGHLFMCRDAQNPHYLWWSKRFREEVGPSNFVEIGFPSDPLQGAFPLAGFLGVFTRNTKHRVVGNQASGFVPIEALSSRGTPAVHACIVTAGGVLFPARDGLFLTNFLERDTELSTAIAPLFYEEEVNGYSPIDWNRANEMALAEYKNRFYFSYPTRSGNHLMAVFSTDTREWYFFSYDQDFHALYVEEDVDDLVGGGPRGIVAVLEDAAATSDAGVDIAMELEPATRSGGDQYINKLFQYVRADVDAGDGTIELDIYIDDRLIRTYHLSGDRRARLLRLPDRLMGKQWRVVLRYTGDEPVAIYAIQMRYIPMGDA